MFNPRNAGRLKSTLLLQTPKFRRPEFISGPQKAFTLAEVLITLAIIGVVAALTIPTVVKNYRRHVIETKLQKFYTSINQALRMSEVENGPIASWGWENYTTNDTDPNDAMNFYNKYFKYLKTSKVEVKKLNGYNYIFIYFVDGTGARMTMYLRDLSFHLNGKNMDISTMQSGKDMFTFRMRPAVTTPSSAVVEEKYTGKINYEPYAFGWDGDYEHLKTGFYYSCYTHGAYCTKLIQMNGWKIPSDYKWL